jgi:hypothetical protein
MFLIRAQTILYRRTGDLLGVDCSVMVWEYRQMPASSGRSLARIEMSDLSRLAGIAAQVEAGLFARNPDGAGRYAGSLVCRALCQGAALHYVDGINGIKDFDVWSFYAQRDDGPFPARWRGKADFGPSKFGRDPGAPPSYAGRRVDCLGRSLPVLPGADPIAVIRGYLSSAHTASAKALAIKAAVLIDPEDHAGMVVWPELASDEVGDNQVKISNLSGDLFRHDAPDNDSILTLTSISERYALLSTSSQRIPNLAEFERSPGTGTRSHAAGRAEFQCAVSSAWTAGRRRHGRLYLRDESSHRARGREDIDVEVTGVRGNRPAKRGAAPAAVGKQPPPEVGALP